MDMGGGCTVDYGFCADNALLLSSDVHSNYCCQFVPLSVD